MLKQRFIQALKSNVLFQMLPEEGERESKQMKKNEQTLKHESVLKFHKRVNKTVYELILLNIDANCSCCMYCSRCI